MSRHPIIRFAVVTALVAASGCSNGDESEPSSTPTTTAESTIGATTPGTTTSTSSPASTTSTPTTAPRPTTTIPVTRPPIATLVGHGNGTAGVTFSPDGDMLASSGFDAAVRLWDLSTGSELAAFEGHSTFDPPTFSPDGTRLASIGFSRVTEVWDTATGETLLSLGEPGDPTFIGDAGSVEFSPDGTVILTTDRSSAAKVWDATSGELLHTLPYDPPDRVVGFAEFSPDGARIVTVANGAAFTPTTKIWDTRTGELLAAIPEETDTAAFSPDGSRLLTYRSYSAALGGPVFQVWDTTTGELVTSHPLPSLSSWVVEIRDLGVFSTDGASVLTMSFDLDAGGAAVVAETWDATTGELRSTVELEVAGTCSDMRCSLGSPLLSPDGQTLIVDSRNRDRIELWDVSTGELRDTLPFAGPGVRLTLSPDGSLLAATAGPGNPGDEGTIVVWAV